MVNGESAFLKLDPASAMHSIQQRHPVQHRHARATGAEAIKACRSMARICLETVPVVPVSEAVTATVCRSLSFKIQRTGMKAGAVSEAGTTEPHVLSDHEAWGTVGGSG